MLHGKLIAVVISAFDEETQIEEVIRSIPEFVDRIVVVNDASRDGTAAKVKALQNGQNLSKYKVVHRIDSFVLNRYNRADELAESLFAAEKSRLPQQEVLYGAAPANLARLVLINHLINGGKGAAVASGYAWCREHQLDVTVTIDGDGQMDPSEMQSVAGPVASGEVDFVKGNRLSHRAARAFIPRIRYLGNSVLSILNKLASGYWRITDSQTGYTSISLHALERIDVSTIYRRYGMPNDILAKVNTENCTLREVDIRPVYGVGEKSKMNVPLVIPKISYLLVRLFFRRLWTKYFLRSFHPLFICYHLGILCLAGAVFSGAIDLWILSETGHRPPLGYYFAFVLTLILGVLFLLFGMWMDIQDNERLMK